MNTLNFNCLDLNLCQESQKPRNLSHDFSQLIQMGSDTDRQKEKCLTLRRCVDIKIIANRKSCKFFIFKAFNSICFGRSYLP